MKQGSIGWRKMGNGKGRGQRMSKERKCKSDILNWEMGLCNGTRYMTIYI